MPAVSPSRTAMNGKLCASMAIFGKSAATTSRERGPTTATSAQWSVTDVRRTRRSGHSVCSHSSIQSRTAAAPPAAVENPAIRFAHQSVTARAHLQRVERVGIHPIEELDRIGSLDVDLAERRGVHHRRALSRRVALAQYRRLQVLVVSREVPGALPLADVLEDRSMGDRQSTRL